ncbi:MAG: Hypothetical protein BHV28_11010 [Candidatus Tokpelaia hoelldobleri]|uniref:DUF2059 domain-containing protein n=1 Tax=Candidatus Tokpelaia hoelldobleri TaxID=1902579 RepID=A0A1U9JVA5_9HYPH|nr:MAG: Hypothetical protein BHV28_11010 [Candidatus Tokpelaia hoelldoblerii]
MTATIFLRRLIAPVAALAVLGGSMQLAGAQGAGADAQKISASQLQAARKAVAAIHATDQFDEFLPGIMVDLKNKWMGLYPNYEKEISAVVDEQALALTPRRTDLEKEAARAYAKQFSEKELNQIAAFYNTEAGKKLIEKGPVAMVEALNAYKIWRQGIAQDLDANVQKALQKKFGEAQQQPAASEGTPASGAN